MTLVMLTIGSRLSALFILSPLSVSRESPSGYRLYLSEELKGSALAVGEELTALIYAIGVHKNAGRRRALSKRFSRLHLDCTISDRI